MTREQKLTGGMDPRFAPVRIGDTVRRPPGSSHEGVRQLLLHLEAVGFEAAPRYLGVDALGREILSWIEGDVPQPPYPGWAMTDRALTDLGALMCRLHEATKSFDVDVADDWAPDWADPSGGTTICHNDLFPENVVFRDGRVVALIDFTMAAPGRPIWDLAIALDVWAPLVAPAQRYQYPPDLDAIRRSGILAAAYGLEPERAEELLNVVTQERTHARSNIAAEIAAGNPSWAAWATGGGEQRSAADDKWIEQSRTQLICSIGLG